MHSDVIKDVIPPVSCFEVDGEEDGLIFGSSSNIHVEEPEPRIEKTEPSLKIKDGYTGGRSARSLMYAE